MYEKEKSLLMAHGCAAAGNSLAVLRTGELTWAAWPHQNQVCLLRLDGDQVETRSVPDRPADGGQSVMQVREGREGGSDWSRLWGHRLEWALGSHVFGSLLECSHMTSAVSH